MNQQLPEGQKKLLGYILFTIIIGYFLFSCSFSGSSSSSSYSSSSTSNADTVGAWVCAQFKVEAMLKSPSTADFEFGGAQKSTEHLYGNSYEVNSYVDAENSFGGTVRRNFTCNIEHNSITDSCSGSCSFQ